jgi:hypothetical protein
VLFAWGAENDEIQVPKKSAETGGHHLDGGRNLSCKTYGVPENWLNSPFAKGTKKL